MQAWSQQAEAFLQAEFDQADQVLTLTLLLQLQQLLQKTQQLHLHPQASQLPPLLHRHQQLLLGCACASPDAAAPYSLTSRHCRCQPPALQLRPCHGLGRDSLQEP
jgi:hypothetical protein